MILHFDQAKVRALLAHALAAPDHRLTYGQTLKGAAPEPGLWLIADDGVYLMSNGLPPLAQPDHVVYADETDPETVDPETMDAVKRQSSGGDDSVEFLDAASVQKAIDTFRPGERYKLAVTPKGISLLAYRPVAKPARKPPARKQVSPRRPKSA